jgi:hypothetical protein
MVAARPTPEFGGRNALLEQVSSRTSRRRRIYHSFNPQGVSIIAVPILMSETRSRSNSGPCSCGPRSPPRSA